MLQTSLLVGHKKIKPFSFFTWEGKSEFLTLERLEALWTTSGLCITDTCERSGLSASGDQQLSCSCNKTKQRRATGEMHVWGTLQTPKSMLLTSVNDSP